MERSLPLIKSLKPDNIRQILDKSDWKTAASLCHVLPEPCRQNYWYQRAIREFSEPFWPRSYKYPFHNYLVARVYFNLGREDEMDSHFRSSPEGRLDPTSIGGVNHERFFEILKEKDSFSIGYTDHLLNEILNHEKKKNYPVPNIKHRDHGEKLDLLREYFGVKPAYEETRENLGVINETKEISKFLVNYLKREYPKVFKEIIIVLTRDEYERYFQSDVDEFPQELREEFFDHHELTPDSLGLVYLERYGSDEKPNVYLFRTPGGKFYYSNRRRKNPFYTVFWERMLELGIIEENYHLLYPSI